jgi:hypothetical protein
MRATPIALLIGISLAAVPAAAQTATASAAPATARASSDTLWSAKPTGVYDIVADVDGTPHNATLTMTADSTGTTRGVIETEGESHSMTVAVNGPELVMTTDTPQGTMTIRLKRQGDKLLGTWARAMEGGKLEGTRRP